MSPEAQRIEIALACGWTDVRYESNYFIGRSTPRFTLRGNNHKGNRLEIPDYLNDLNAMNEAEKALDDEQDLDYSESLESVVKARWTANNACDMQRLPRHRLPLRRNAPNRVRAGPRLFCRSIRAHRSRNHANNLSILTTKTMKPHYYVFTKFEKTPGRETLAEATAEAEQLAAQNPGTSFEILQCLGVSSVPKASTFWMDGVEPEQKAMPSGLDAEIEKASNQYAEAIAIYLEAEDELRNSFDDHNRASYYKGRRDALTALKNLGK